MVRDESELNAVPLPGCLAEAQQLNRDIFESLYYGALEGSCELATEIGAHATHEGSPASRGVLQVCNPRPCSRTGLPSATVAHSRTGYDTLPTWGACVPCSSTSGA